VEVGQYAVYYARWPWRYLRRSGQLTWSGRWEAWRWRWRWSEQTWLWSRGFSAGGLEVVWSLEAWDVSATEVHIRRMGSL
jgi:hypothetical protein